MPTLNQLCTKYYGTRDLYEVLGVSRDASEKIIKKAYHQMSLKVHPDRVEEDEKLDATEKFKVLGKIHSILSDRAKRGVYDETGSYDEEDEVSERNWMDYWRMLFKPITQEDIVAYEKTYKGSDLELIDLKKNYLQGKGDMDYITDSTPFATVDDEPRIVAILQTMIDSGEIPEYEIFTNEPEKKKEKRHNKSFKEAKEVEKLNKMMEKKNGEKGKEQDLALMIKKRQEGRSVQMESFFDQLAEKYGGAAKSPKGRKSNVGGGPRRTSARKKN